MSSNNQCCIVASLLSVFFVFSVSAKQTLATTWFIKSPIFASFLDSCQMTRLKGVNYTGSSALTGAGLRLFDTTEYS